MLDEAVLPAHADGAEVVYYHIRATLPERCAVALPRHADHQAKVPRSSCLHPCESVLYDHGSAWVSAEPCCRLEKGVRRRFSFEVEARALEAINPGVEQSGKTCRVQHSRTNFT